MNHGIRGRKFGRDTKHRKALLQNLAKELIRYEQITTTLPKAKDLRPIVEKLVTLGRRGGLHAYRQAISVLGSTDLASKLTKVLGERYKDRPGGYTRIVKAGFRHGDNSPMAVIEFIDRDPAAKPKPEKKVEEAQDAPLPMMPAGA